MRNKWYKCKISQINSTNVEFKTSYGAKTVWTLSDLRISEAKNNLTGKTTKYAHVWTTDRNRATVMDADTVVILAKPVEVKPVQYAGKKYKFYFPKNF